MRESQGTFLLTHTDSKRKKGNMNEGLKKIEELWKTDAAFQEKLNAAMETYTGEQTEQAVFEGVLAPLAKEYGVSASFEEFQEYIEKIFLQDKELNDAEINQVVGGGKGGGLGKTWCYVIGGGAGGGAGSESGGACAFIGAGWGHVDCMAKGDSY